MLTMTEILDKPRTWAALTRSTQITKGPVYVERIWYRVNDSGDEIELYDGDGTVGKAFNITELTADTIIPLFIGLVFADGLYYYDKDGDAVSVISYVPLRE